MDRIFKSNFGKRIQHFSSIFYIYLPLDILVIIYMVNRFGSEDLYIFIILAINAFLLVFIPTYYIHHQYSKINKNDILKINNINRNLQYEKGNMLETIYFNNIKILDVYKTPPLIENRAKWLPFASYNYSKLILKDGKTLIITCFLVSELDKNISIENDKIEIHRVAYPRIRN